MARMHELADPMARALALAGEARGVSEPNPRVGCVIVSAQGEVLGQGHTQRAGEAHAEVMALRDAQARGYNVAGATVYVTLEPCAHHGRTPPCADALVAARVGKVVVSIADPNPLVNGHGFDKLRAAGIDVVIGPGAAEAFEINRGFFSRMIRRKPWVRMKVAATLDGRTAMADGRSQWITSEAARLDGHQWRERASAVLTGIGTVAADDPRLDARGDAVQLQPALVLVDSRLECRADAKIFGPARRRFVYTASDTALARADLQALGVETIRLADAGGKVDLAAMMADLAARQMNEIHVEAGYRLNGSLIRAGLVDELLLYAAPRLLDEGMGIARLPGMTLDAAPEWAFVSADLIGSDVRLIARRRDGGRF